MNFHEAVADWLARHHKGSLTAGAAKLTNTYRNSGSSSAVDPAAYLATRAPATFAATARAMREAAAALPDFAPSSLLDVGSGAGSASWAAVAQWPSLAKITFADNDIRFLDLATALAGPSNIPALQAAQITQLSLHQADLPAAGLVVASYILAECPQDAAAELALKLWRASSAMVLIVEPGTPAGFARIRRARDALIGAGAHIAAPCTHERPCPMHGDAWCHFKSRLARSRAHMHAKSAHVPFEDEPFAYVAACRELPQRTARRIIGPPLASKAGVEITSCAAPGISRQLFASRDKAAFKQIRKLSWGDAF